MQETKSLAEQIKSLLSERNPMAKRTIEWASLTRSQQMGAGTSGGFTGQNNVLPVVEALRPQSVIVQAGATLIRLPIPATLPRIESGAVAHFLSETEACPASELEFSASNIFPRRVGCNISVSMQLLSQTPEMADAVLGKDITSAIALALDNAALSGIGGAEPIGVLNTSGIAEPVTFAGNPQLIDATSFEKCLADNFAERAGEMSFIASPATRAKWRETQTFIGSSLPLWSDSNTIVSRPAFATPAILNSDSRMIYGRFSDLLVIFFGEIRINFNPYIKAPEGKVQIYTETFADIVPLRASSFARSTDSAAL